MTTKADFTIDQERITITMETFPRNTFTLTGTFDGSLGQCAARIAEHYQQSGESIPALDVVLAAWEAYHLKDLVNVPAETLAAVLMAMEDLDGSDYPESEGGHADEFEEADFSETNDTIDSRDVIKRIEYLRAFLADLPDDVTPETYDPDADKNGNRADAVQELADLTELESSGEAYAPDWQYGETLINGDYFTTYAEELVKDIADLPKDIPSYIVIDWEATAQNLKVDYTEINFRGETFYIR